MKNIKEVIKMKKIVIIGTIFLMLVITMLPTASATVNSSADIGISDLNWAIETDQGSGTLYLWWQTNDAAKACAGLNVNISIDGSVIGTTLANTHLNMGDAWTLSSFSTTFGSEGTYTIKVAFVDFTEPVGGASNNKVEKMIDVGEGIFADLANLGYGIYFAMDQALSSTGMEILDDLPLVPILAGVVVSIVAFVVYKRYKKKKAKTKAINPYRQRTASMQSTTRYPPYGPNTYYDDYGDQFQ